MLIFFIIFLIAWGIVAARDVFFWTYLWQLKEYRKDRMRAYFDMPSAQRLILNERIIITVGLLLAAIVGVFVSFLAFPLLFLGIIFYGVLCYRIVVFFIEKQIRMPRKTLRAGIIVSGMGVSLLMAAGVSLYLQRAQGMAILLALTLFVPALAALCVAITKPVAVFLKGRIFERARLKREQYKNLFVIGITGSFGKTSMKEILAHILGEKCNVFSTPDNVNTEVGIAQAMLHGLKNDHEIFIAEMGAYRIGEIAVICHFVKPNMGILTGISPQHIALFGSLRNIQKAKYELIESLPEKGLAIFNGDNEHCRTLFRLCKKPKRMYTSNPLEVALPHLVFAQKVKETKSGTIIEVQEGGRAVMSISVPLLGRHNAETVIGAMCVARSLGMTFEEIAKGCQTLQAPPHTLQLRKGIKHTKIIDDSYSANPDGVFVALDILKRTEGGKKICIFYPLIELGELGAQVHAKIGAKIGATCDYCIVVGQDFFSVISKEAKDAGMHKDALFCIPDGYIAMRKAQELCNEGDVILLENRVPEVLINGLVV